MFRRPSFRSLPSGEHSKRPGLAANGRSLIGSHHSFALPSDGVVIETVRSMLARDGCSQRLSPRRSCSRSAQNLEDIRIRSPLVVDIRHWRALMRRPVHVQVVERPYPNEDLSTAPWNSVRLGIRNLSNVVDLYGRDRGGRTGQAPAAGAWTANVEN